MRLFRNSTLTTHVLNFDEGNESIICTPEHPFYVLKTKAETPIVRFKGRDENTLEGQWVQAKHLKVGDKVLLSDGKTAILTSAKLEHLSKPITTYNFEVQDFHTYYVGEQGILVHNDCPYAYLDEALQRQGLDKVPEGGFKETWVRDGYKFEVRAHAGDPTYTSAKQIFRVSRQPVYSGVGQGAGTSYLATNGVWYHQSTLIPIFKGGTINPLYNAWAAINTHIPIR